VKQPDRLIAQPSRPEQFVRGASCAIVAVAIWAGWLVIMRLGLTTRLSAPDLAALRFSVAGPVLLPIVVRRGLAIGQLGWPGFAAVVTGAGAPVALLIAVGLQFAPVAHAGALYQGVVPLAVACVASIALGERINTPGKVGLCLVVGGSFLIGGLGLAVTGGRESIGHVMFLAAAFLTACYTVAVRHARIDGFHAAALGAVVSALFYIPVYLVFVRNALFSVPLPDLVFQALYQGVLTAAISLPLYGRAIQLLGAANAAAFVALGPMMAALTAVPVLGEWPSTAAWVAILIVAAGVYLASGAPLATRTLPPPAPIR